MRRVSGKYLDFLIKRKVGFGRWFGPLPFSNFHPGTQMLCLEAQQLYRDHEDEKVNIRMVEQKCLHFCVWVLHNVIQLLHLL